MSNRLAEESSPYLLQHKDNPVDWYPWGPDALAAAQREEKPILLSIGYAACHWCHVMEHESFENEATAAVMNENFISIKVDREERPDIDSIYMEAVQAMTGHGGWPMTMFLTPDGRPFYGGTYFPPEDRHGMPAFTTVLEAVADAWRNRRDEVESQSDRLVEHIGTTTRLKPSEQSVSGDILDAAADALSSSFDELHGGFGRAPKFPQPMTLDFLMRLRLRGDERAGQMASKTLDAMASGGVFDQLGGGFHRYSVDREWVVPHFEKMLYDNAQLLRTYTRSWLLDKDPLHREVAVATAHWMVNEMRDESGGFYASMDADSEGVEGKFYVWSLDEVRVVLRDSTDVAMRTWGLTDDGNFEGVNIPVRAQEPRDIEAVEQARAMLLEHRARRVPPATDNKVLTSWSCMAAAALVEAGVALGENDWVVASEAAVNFTLTKMRVNGRLMRSYRRDGERETIKHLGVAEDYAALLEVCLALYEATHDPRWLTEARWAADEAIRLFHDSEAGGFFSTGSDAEKLVVRPKELVDNAVPSPNSVLALELQRLARLTENTDYEDRALEAIRIVLPFVERSPQGFGHLLQAVDFYTSSAVEIVIIGEPERDDTRALLRVVTERWLPNKVLAVSDEPEAHADRIPLLRDRARLDGKATAYVCEHGTCKLPVDTPEALETQLLER